MIYLLLFIEFFKTGLFAIGGGLATLPFLYDMADKFDWFTRSDLVNMIAVSESTPGPIGINMATYVGYTTAGALGAIIATLSLVLPSLIIISIVYKFLVIFKDNKYIDGVFYTLRPAVCALICAALFEIFKVTFINVDFNSVLEIIDVKNFILFMILFVLVYKFKKHPIIYIISGAVLGVILSL